MLISLPAIAVDEERCFFSQNQTVLKLATGMCNDHLNEFAERSNASCKVLKYDKNVCWAECEDENNEKLAKVRVDMSSDCEREQVYYNRTVIKYYR